MPPMAWARAIRISAKVMHTVGARVTTYEQQRGSCRSSEPGSGQ